MMNLQSLLKKKSQEEKKKLSAQKKIPVKAIHSGLIITQNNKLVRVLRVSAVNTQLMSDSDLQNLFESYEAFLKSINFPIQQMVMSQPIDLKLYIDLQKVFLQETADPHKKRLLQSYIDYSKEMETSSVMQRQRYLLLSAPIKGNTKKAYEAANKMIIENEKHILNSLGSMELTAVPLNDLDLIKTFHILFDYETAKFSPIQSDYVTETITGSEDE